MGALILRGARAWDGTAEAAVERSIVCANGRIAGDETAAGDAQEIDLTGCTVIPGLIEGHAHLCFNAGADWRQVYDNDTPASMLLRMANSGKKMLEAGITTVRDLGAPTELSIEIREAFRSGLVPGPNLLVAGAPITTTGGHCWFMGGEADGEVELRKAVRQRVKAGCDWIKIMATGGNMTAGTNVLAAQYSVGELRAVVEEAHRLRKRVAAHCHGTAGIRVAVEAGVDTLEHCSFVGEGGVDRDDSALERIAQKSMVISPTISVGYRTWTDDGRKAARRDLLRKMLELKCDIAMSTDCGIPGVPHEALAGALDVVQEMSGLAPAEVLKLATSTSAELLGMGDRGTIAPGKRADLVVLDGDPTEDLEALTRVRMVIKGGEVANSPHSFAPSAHRT